MKDRRIGLFLAAAGLFAALSGVALADETAGEGRKWLSFSAFADVETAYICRGTIYDTRPFSAQYAAVEADLGTFGVIEPSIWT